MKRSAESVDDREERIGIFPGWGWLYAAVILYGISVILVLYLLTLALDFGSR